MATALKWSPKDPNDTVDLWFDCTAFLPLGTTITSAVLTVTAPLVKVDDDVESPLVRIRVSGGTLGQTPITALITLDDGQIFEITNTLLIKERIK